ncbi:hypothetical protein ABZX92_21920, partial [Lentzea sp. NPDC006480]
MTRTAVLPFGGWFDEVADELFAAISDKGLPADTVQQVTVDRGHLRLGLLHVAEQLVEAARGQ